MAISFKAVGSYIDTVSSSTVPLPSGPAAGDRMFLLVSNKEYSDTIGVSAGWTPIGSQYADGTVSSGSGTGSVSVHAWYRDWESGDTDPTVSQTPSATDGGAAVIILFEKDPGDTWDTPLATNAAWTLNTAATPQTVSAVGALVVPDGAAVMALLAIRDDVATITRPTDGIGVASGITWDGNYVESPATHHSSTSGFDSAADLGYRMVTTGGTVTLQLTATLGDPETGAIKFVVQGLVPDPPLITSEILRPIDGLESDAGNSTWSTIDDAVTQPTSPGDVSYATYSGTTTATTIEKLKVAAPSAGYTIIGATLWVLAHALLTGVMKIQSIRIKLNGTWYDLGLVNDTLTTSPQWFSYTVTGMTESSDSDDIGFEWGIGDSLGTPSQAAKIDVAYLELQYLEIVPSVGGFFAWW